MSATTLTAQCFCLPFASSLRTFIMSTPPGLYQDTCILHFALEALEHKLKRVTWIHYNFCHENDQRDRWLLMWPLRWD